MSEIKRSSEELESIIRRITEQVDTWTHAQFHSVDQYAKWHRRACHERARCRAELELLRIANAAPTLPASDVTGLAPLAKLRKEVTDLQYAIAKATPDTFKSLAEHTAWHSEARRKKALLDFAIRTQKSEKQLDAFHRKDTRRMAIAPRNESAPPPAKAQPHEDDAVARAFMSISELAFCEKTYQRILTRAKAAAGR